MKAAKTTPMKTIKFLMISTAILFLAGACLGASGQKTAATSAAEGPMAIPAELSCGVCGMFPARYPQWQSQVIFSDGKMVPFDGCKDMFKYLLMMSKFDQDHTRNDVATIWVKDFNNGSWFNGEKATYVVGSEQMGPMGKELIPFETQESAEKFQAENGGTIHSFTEINMEMVGKLGMGGMMMKGQM